MGATNFQTYTELNPKENLNNIFDRSRQMAKYRYGHEGYTGSIAEKDTCVIITDVPQTVNAAQDLIAAFQASPSNPINDKYGPAGAIRIKQRVSKWNKTRLNGWMFFGMASE